MFEIELTDGQQITAEIQGSGGVLRIAKCVRMKMRDLLEEARVRDGLPPSESPDVIVCQDRYGDLIELGRHMVARGCVMQVRHAARLSLWTDPENETPSQRLTHVPVEHVMTIRHDDVEVWTAQTPRDASAAERVMP